MDYQLIVNTVLNELFSECGNIITLHPTQREIVIASIAHTLKNVLDVEQELEVLPIIQSMATSELILTDNYCECHYCTLSGVPLDKRRATIKPEEHDADCPVRLAAAWLEEQRKTQP